jgi:hypothetical protein
MYVGADRFPAASNSKQTRHHPAQGWPNSELIFGSHNNKEQLRRWR